MTEHPETETVARPRWEDNASLIDAIASRGYVGKLERRSFIIYKPEFDGSQYRLLCLIGDREGESLYADGPDELKAEAERWLTGFVASLGAVFPGGHPDGNAIEAYCATEAGDDDGRHLLQYAVRLPDGTAKAYGDQSWVKAGLGARDHDGASTVVRDIWVSYGPWRTHDTTAPGRS